MTLQKPLGIADLEPPFRHIGEPGWATRLRVLLADYGVPEPRPVDSEAIEARELQLGFRFDESLREFLLTIGPLDFRALRVLPPEDMRPLGQVWFAAHMSENDRARLGDMIAVMDYLGTGDFVAWDRNSGNFVLVGHDPAGIRPWRPTFDDCIREQCIELAAGYYGWPDKEIEQLVENAKKSLVPGGRSG